MSTNTPTNEPGAYERDGLIFRDHNFEAARFSTFQGEGGRYRLVVWDDKLRSVHDAAELTDDDIRNGVSAPIVWKTETGEAWPVEYTGRDPEADATYSRPSVCEA